MCGTLGEWALGYAGHLDMRVLGVMRHFDAGHLDVRNTWMCGTLGCAEHLDVRNTWMCGTLGCAEHLCMGH
jgi:hypothetical protein